ncbi:MAG: methylmalonyl-CoA epimerase [Planctomycetes bacterium]|nr:methylmalonyl-CoA epimerase [Planctomycetota bacterium]
MQIDHIGIAVTSLEEGAKFYADGLGLEKLETEVVEEQKVRVLKLEITGVHIELLEPLTENEGPIGKFIEKNGGRGGIHHIAYRVDDVVQMTEHMKSLGYKALYDEPRIGAGGLKIMFLHPKGTAGVLTALCQHI